MGGIDDRCRDKLREAKLREEVRSQVQLGNEEDEQDGQK
jgi:hypothetical protein